MKKIVAVGITIFVMFMSYVFVGGFLQKQQKELAVQEKSATTSTTSSSSSTAPSTAYTVSQVANHNSTTDCWLIINNNVYDVSKFLGEHPGGASTIIPYCGKEATRAFDTQDRGAGGGHSSSATAMLADYQIGVLK